LREVKEFIMSETTLRWKGRLGSLKGVAVFVLIFAVIFLLIALGDLSTATGNPTTPQTVTIGQLVKGELGAERYISVSGLALYSEFYKETENGQTVNQFYFIVDEDTGDMLLVKAANPLPAGDSQKQATLSGLTHSTDSKLQSLIESDFQDMHKAGVQTTATLYLTEGQKPADVTQSTLLVGGLLLVIVLCVATFFFPSTVFGPKPIDFAAATAAVGEPGVKATGRFQRLASVQPSITIGKGTRQFNNGIANIVTLNDGGVMLYIHHVLTYRTYGVKTGQRESDWAVMLDRSRVQEVEPGKVYGWRDRLAARVRYQTEAAAPASKPQALIVTFNHAGAQRDFVNLLQQRGFTVGTGDAPLV
jgi:hypothetical protein